MKRRLSFFCAIALLLIFYALLTLGIRELSFTSDEPAHIAVGYSILARGPAALWLIPRYGHPPLLNVLEASLLYLANPHIPVAQLDGWGSGTINYFRAFEDYMKPVERVEFTARAPISLLTVVLGALIFRWGKALWGEKAGLLALIALVFDPLLLAHGRLATTDVGTTLFGTAALYLTWRWMERPRWPPALGAGFLLGLTMLAKMSGLFWTAAVGLLGLATLWRYRKKGGVILAHGTGMAVMSLLVLWAGHAFTWGPVAGLPVSLPAPGYWNGLIYQVTAAGGHLTFALGQIKGGHRWWYFPLAFALKNPLPLLMSLMSGLITLLRRPFSWSRALALTLFPAFYTALAMWSGINIGYRHMLPIHPFLYLTIGGGLWLWGWGAHALPWRRWALGAIGLWYIGATLSLFPYEIAYFNELAGGPENGQRYLVDSNLDWGQGYKALRRYLTASPEPRPQLAYLYNVPPELYNITEYTPAPILAPFHPHPGRYIISITGQQYYPEAYGWFSQIAPTAKLAFSFFVYDIAPPPLAWFAQCTVPAAPLDPDLIARGFEQKNLRQVSYDCAAAWLYPTGGERPGGYGFHYEIVSERPANVPLSPAPRPTDSFIARRIADLRLSLNMPLYTAAHPAFVLYEQERPPRLPPSQPVAALAETEGFALSSSYLQTPIVMNGPLTFLGVAACQDDEGLDVETWWRVTAPPTRPFSIMGHLLTAQGEVLDVADGLGVPVDALQPRDIVVQRHRFGAVPEGLAVQLRTGAYWLDTLKRWTVTGSQNADLLIVQVADMQNDCKRRTR